MKVDNSNRTSPLAGSTPTASSARTAKPAPQSSASNTQDSVKLSSASGQLQTLEAGINEASGFDISKVEAIKQAISEGRFTINPEAIADKLIASTRELLAKQQG